MTHKNTDNWLKEKTVAKQFQYVQIGCLNIFDIPRRHSFLWGAPKPSPIIGSPAEAAETWWSLHVIACHCNPDMNLYEMVTYCDILFESWDEKRFKQNRQISSYYIICFECDKAAVSAVLVRRSMSGPQDWVPTSPLRNRCGFLDDVPLALADER